MVLIFQSFWVAVTGFWRYLLILPLLTLQIFLFGGLAGMIPVVGIVVPGASIIFGYLIAIRTTYAGLGESGPPLWRQLVTASVIFTLIESVILFSLFWTGFLALMVSDGNGLSDIFRTVTALWTKEGSYDIQWREIGIWLLVAFHLLAAAFVHISLIVPIAATAWSATERRPDVGMFYGFGASFVPLAVIGFIVIVLQIYFGIWYKIIIVWFWFIFAVWGLFAGELPELPEAGVVLDFGAAFISNIFLYYWQASAAGLAFIKRYRRDARVREEKLLATFDETRVTARSLRKAREHSI